MSCWSDSKVYLISRFRHNNLGFHIVHAFSLSVKVPVTLSGAEVKAAIRVKRLFVSHLGLLGCLVLGILLAIVALAPTWPLVLERLEFHKEKMVKIDTGSQQQSIIWTCISTACCMSYTLEEVFCFRGAVWLCSVTITEQRGTVYWEQLREWWAHFFMYRALFDSSATHSRWFPVQWHWD